MYCPRIEHVTELPIRNGIERNYVNAILNSYGGGYACISFTTNDGIVNAGDIMVHLPAISFVGANKDLQLI